MSDCDHDFDGRLGGCCKKCHKTARELAEIQSCPGCGKSEPEVSFDADTFTLDCDECVGYRRAVPRAYQRQDETVTNFSAEGRSQRGESVAKLG